MKTIIKYRKKTVSNGGYINAKDLNRPAMAKGVDVDDTRAFTLLKSDYNYLKSLYRVTWGDLNCGRHPGKDKRVEVEMEEHHGEAFTGETVEISEDEFNNIIVSNDEVSFEHTKILNYTPHSINIVDEAGNNVRTIAPAVDNEYLPRLVEEVRKLGEVDGIPLVRKTYGKCKNLPQPRHGVYLIVSGLIATAMKRDDLLVPNTVRNEKGQIVGATSLSKVV